MTRVASILEALLALLAASLSLSSVVMASDPTTFGLDLVGMGLCTIAAYGLALAVRLIVAFRNPRGQRLRALSRRRSVLLLPAALIVASAVLIELDVPFHARFTWSRVALESAAQDARGMENLGEDDWRWIGLFRIHGVDTDERGRAHLDLGECGMLDRCEFVFDPGRRFPPDTRHGKPLDEHWSILSDPF